MNRVLYLSYDGALDPLGRSQVVPYLEGLAAEGFRHDLLTFEKPKRWEDRSARQGMRERLEDAGVGWIPLAYHQKPTVLSTAWDLFKGYRRVASLAHDRNWAITHSRSYPCTLIACLLRERFGIPFVFDMRGFYPEERVDGGLWRRNGPLFRVAKRLEAGFARDAGAIVTLTEASLPGVQELVHRSSSRAHVCVIPTAVDLRRFQPPREKKKTPFVLGYFGSLGTWYLLDEMLDLGGELLRQLPGSELLFLVNGDERALEDKVREKRMPPNRISVRSVPHERIPEALEGVHATVALIRPSPSKLASAATKFGESLALGIPVIVNRAVGDSAAVVERDGVGVVIDDFSPASYRRAVKRIIGLARSDGILARCRRAAEARYSLSDAVSAYGEIYRRILEGG